MPKYTVSVSEIWTCDVEVEADTEEEAKRKAAKLVYTTEPGEREFEYSRELDEEAWLVWLTCQEKS